MKKVSLFHDHMLFCERDKQSNFNFSKRGFLSTERYQDYWVSLDGMPSIRALNQSLFWGRVHERLQYRSSSCLVSFDRYKQHLVPCRIWRWTIYPSFWEIGQLLANKEELKTDLFLKCCFFFSTRHWYSKCSVLSSFTISPLLLFFSFTFYVTNLMISPLNLSTNALKRWKQGKLSLH